MTIDKRRFLHERLSEKVPHQINCLDSILALTLLRKERLIQGTLAPMTLTLFGHKIVPVRHDVGAGFLKCVRLFRRHWTQILEINASKILTESRRLITSLGVFQFCVRFSEILPISFERSLLFWKVRTTKESSTFSMETM